MWFSQESNSRYMEGGRNDFLFCCRLLYMLVFPSFWQLELQITGVLKRLYFSYGNLNIMTTPIIIHWTHYLFSDWPKAYSEVSKSVLVRSSSCRLYNNRIWKNLRPHEYVKSPFLKIYNLEKQKHDFYFLFFVQCIIEQLLDSVVVITRIIKVSVRVISPTSIVAPIEKW